MSDTSLSVSVEVSTADTRWDALDFTALAERACLAGARVARIAGDYEVSILACDDGEIAGLNASFRGKAAPTNVLSWPAVELAAVADGGQPSGPTSGELGDIAISYDTCQREAETSGGSFENHVTHLVLHGFLHLLGYDHESDLDATLMEGLEIKALENLGIGNPYE